MRAAAALTGLALLSTPALATEIGQPFAGERPMTVDIHAGLPLYGTGAAFGARLGIPLIDNGFINSINNAVYLSVGADAYYVDLGGPGNSMALALGLPVALQWDFFFSDKWSAFGTAGINVFLNNGFLNGNGLLIGNGWIISSVGGRYHINESTAFILRLGSPYAAIGVQFDL